LKKEEQVIKKWGEIWDRQGETMIKGCNLTRYGNDYSPIKRVLELTGQELDKEDVVLEIGCGNGILVSYLSGFVKKAYGADFVEKMVSKAVKRNNTVYIVSEASKIPFADNTFDKVFSNSMFHYFPSFSYAENALLEMMRVCKSDGILFIGDVPPPQEIHYYWACAPIKKKLLLPVYLIYRFIKYKVLRFPLADFLYYKKDFFERFSKKRNYRCSCIEQTAEQKKRNTTMFRFDVILKKS